MQIWNISDGMYQIERLRVYAKTSIRLKELKALLSLGKTELFNFMQSSRALARIERVCNDTACCSSD